MNNKGFMMAEVIVVSSIVLVFLTGLYLSYNKLFSIYNTRVNYYDSETLYGLVYYRDTLIKENLMNTAINTAKTNENKILDLFSDNVITKTNSGDKVFLIYNEKQRINSNMINGINVTFTEYIDYLSTAITYESNYIMLMERCTTIDDCTYAYLEVYDGYET